MEIKYTNFALDSEIYGHNEITALIDENGSYLDDTIYDIRTLSIKSNLPVGFILKLNGRLKSRKIVFDMLSEMEVTKDVLKKPFSKLSSTEQIKILIIKVCSSNAKNLILESLDTYLNYKDLMQIIKSIKNHLSEMEKNVIITMNKIDNLIELSNRYLVIKDGNIVYNGKDFSKVPYPTEIKIFTELANAKGAKLKDYKEANDLLKAIYRSVK